MLNVAIAVTTGLFVGSMSGLVGIGGGIFLVPLLLNVFKVDMHTAAGTSLAIVIPTAIVGAISHFGRGSTDIRLAVLISIGAIVGSFVGAWAGNLVPGLTLKKVFAVLLVLVSINLLLDAFGVPMPWAKT